MPYAERELLPEEIAEIRQSAENNAQLAVRFKCSLSTIRSHRKGAFQCRKLAREAEILAAPRQELGKDIAARLGIAAATVHRVRRLNGICRSTGRLPPEEATEVAQSTETDKALAARYSCTVGTIRRTRKTRNPRTKIKKRQSNVTD